MKIALVHDDLVQQGGAERLFAEMVSLWPQADVYTLLASPWAKEKYPHLKISSLQRIPFSRSWLYRPLFFLHPLTWEGFDFSDYEVVLSSSARFAYGIITSPQTKHIAYLNHPGRMIWEPRDYFGSDGWTKALFPVWSHFRQWSCRAGQRPDYLIANSGHVASKLERYWHRQAEVIYPFVDLGEFQRDGLTPLEDQTLEKSPYYLVISRLVRWKKLELAVEACSQLGKNLVVIGDGPERERLARLAGRTVRFVGRLKRGDVINYLKGCQALLHPQEEDFGITPLEAMAAGKPVIAYQAGGVLETVVAGETGLFFAPQTLTALVEVLRSFEASSFNADRCREQAQKFSRERFRRELKAFVDRTYAQSQSILPGG